MPQPDINSEQYWASRWKLMKKVAGSFGVNSESITPPVIKPPTLLEKIRRNHGLTNQPEIDQDPYEILKKQLRDQNLLDR